MHHYTYILKDPVSDMKYVGVRSCKCSIPSDPYKGSSAIMTNKQKARCEKVVLGIFDTREEAMAHEIALHRVLNVVKDPTYWNRAAATTTGHTNLGLVHTKEALEKISQRHKNKVVTEETRQKQREAYYKRLKEGRAMAQASGEAHGARKYRCDYLWKNIDGREFEGHNLEFQKYINEPRINNINRLLRGERIQEKGWYVIKNLDSNCETSQEIYTKSYNWVNGQEKFTGTGEQLRQHLQWAGVTGINKVLRGERKTVEGWRIMS